MASEPDKPPGGQRSLRIGKYKVSSPITAWGKGGFYKAVDAELGREVAFKILPQEIASNPALREKYQHQALQAAELRHENIVTVYEFGEANGTWFLTLEPVEGFDLPLQVQRKGPFSIEEAGRLLAQAAKALHQVHKQEIDLPAIAPAHYLVARKGGQSILKWIPVELFRETRAEASRSTGTADYRAPEQKDEGQRTKDKGKDSSVVSPPREQGSLASAMYALGGTFLYMITGKSPRSGGADPLAVAASKVTGPLLKVVKRLLAKDPEDRYPTPAALLKDLDSGSAESQEEPAVREDKDEGPRTKDKEKDSSLVLGPSSLSNVDDEATGSDDQDLLRGLAQGVGEETTRDLSFSATKKRGSQKNPAREQEEAPQKEETAPKDLDPDELPEEPDAPKTSGAAPKNIRSALPSGTAPKNARALPPPSPPSRPAESEKTYEEELDEMPEKKPTDGPSFRPGRPDGKNNPKASTRQTPAQNKPPKDLEDMEEEENGEPGEAGARTDKKSGGAEQGNGRLLLLGGLAGVVVIAAIVVAVIMTKGPSKDQPSKRLPGADLANKDKDHAKDKTQDKEPAKDKEPVGKDKEPAKDQKDKKPAKDTAAKDKSSKQPEGPPLLYKPKVPIDVKKLFKEVNDPWDKPEKIPKDAPLYRVRRVPATAEEAKSGKTFTALSDAIAAAPKGQTTTIMIYDNGPLFETPITVADKSVIVTGAPGYRPLLVWDLEKTKTAPKEAKKDKREQEQPAAFLTAEKGNLRLDNLDVVLEWPEDAVGPAALVRMVGGDFFSLNCTYSVSSQHKAGVSVVRFEGSTGGKKCLLRLCLARGNNLTALDIQAPGSEVLLDSCLLVGGEQPLVRCLAQAAGKKASTLRVIRSTLMAGNVAFQVQGPAAEPGKPVLHWLGWDAFVAYLGTRTGGVLLDLPSAAHADGIRWKAVNCLYAGWKNLLSGRHTITGEDMEAWRKQWKLPEGDVSINTFWPRPAHMDLAEVLAVYFSSDKTPPAYAATYTKGLLLGCTLYWLPAVRTNWLPLTYRRFVVPEIEVLKEKEPPVIPKTQDGKYYGGRINLRQTDLGAYLKEIQQKKKLGNQVVLHLAGSGVQKTSPIYVRNTSLVLYFEPPRGAAKPLVLEADSKAHSDKSAPALIQVEGGSLEIIGGTIRFPESKTAKVPNYLIAVRSGNLRIHGARLQGPLSKMPESFWGLIRIEGSGQIDPTLVRGCTLHNTMLLSGKVGLHIAGIGARTRIQHCVFVCGHDAIHFQPGPTASAWIPAWLNVQCTLENNTFAAKQAVVYVEDNPTWQQVVEPIVIQSASNVFLNPFSGEDDKAPYAANLILYNLVTYGGAIPRGMLAWQGDSDVFDKRLHTYVLQAGKDGKHPEDAPAQTFTIFEHLWGSLGNSQPVLDVPFKNTLNLEKLDLAQLEVPAHSALKNRTPGADLTRLGILKKKE